MSDASRLVLAFAVGLGLGLFYFGGLWLTVRRLPAARHPVLLVLGSFLGRTAVTLVGFYLIMGGRWERLLASLVAFTLMRFGVVVLTRSTNSPVPVPKEGDGP